MRALAVVAVMAYHLQIGWAGGGYLGVDVFFVLSGFLITGLLVEERAGSGRISLRGFWLRRARRLLPGLVVMLGVLALCDALRAPAINLSTLPGDIVAALFYFANWHFIAGHSSYFAQFVTPSPLEHTWSLAIEEQFYLLWPLALLVLARLGGRRWRPVAMVATAVLAVASLVDMALVAHRIPDPTRAYFGTDTRAFELMIGALLALTFEQRLIGGTERGGIGRRVRTGVGWLALAVLVAGFGLVTGPPHWMFDGGFGAVAVLTAVVLATVVRDGSGTLARFLGLGPVRWIGRISYGLYLWHWPVYVLLSVSTTGLASWAVDVLRLAATVGAATLSFYLVEEPIRRGGLSGLRRTVSMVPVGTALAAVVVAVISPLPSAASTTGVLPEAHPEGTVFGLARSFSNHKPLRVTLVGDSMMQFATPALTSALEATGDVKVSSMAYPGWGLTGFGSWRSYLHDGFAQSRPDVVVATWGWDYALAEGSPRKYLELLDQAVRVMMPPGGTVEGIVFLQFPVVGPFDAGQSATRAAMDRGFAAWNAAVAEEASRHPRSIAYLPVASAVELRGRYSTWLPSAAGRWVRVRTTDQVHLCPAGAARYADAVLADLEASWHLSAPRGAWWAGRWRAWSYYYANGACPSDGPPSRTGT